MGIGGSGPDRARERETSAYEEDGQSGIDVDVRECTSCAGRPGQDLAGRGAGGHAGGTMVARESAEIEQTAETARVRLPRSCDSP